MTWATTLTAIGVTNTTRDYTLKRSINKNNLSNNAKTAQTSNLVWFKIKIKGLLICLKKN